jgi:ribonuclease P protein component
LENSKFPKKERLTGVREIDLLFKSSQSFFEWPFIVKYRYVDADIHPLRVVFSVPKRKVRSAVDRNLIKRLCREAFRKNKSTLFHVLSGKEHFLHLMLIYTGSKKMEYKVVEQKIILILHRLQHVGTNSSPNNTL